MISGNGCAIECHQVSKRYGEVVAVDQVSLTIAEGEIFGLVGPNGAGKTTLIEMIESLRTPDGGSIRVLGLDPGREANELLERIGIQLQTTSIQPNLKVREALTLFASLYRNRLREPGILLESLSLTDKSDSRFRKLSGGQKQRVAIALALVHDPAVLFFDELTTGLDPQARGNMWQLVKELRAQGKTIFLTTHYMEEAEALCDRVAIIDHGRIIAVDSPGNLVRGLGAESRIHFRVEDDAIALEALAELRGVTRVEIVAGGFTLYSMDSDSTLVALVRLADTRGATLRNIRTEVPNLDDVFLSLTGRDLRE